MSKPPCPQLDAVLSAAGGALPDELGRHAAGCPECADALLVQGFLVAGAARKRRSAAQTGRNVQFAALVE